MLSPLSNEKLRNALKEALLLLDDNDGGNKGNDDEEEKTEVS